jgi:hypothetical protein
MYQETVSVPLLPSCILHCQQQDPFLPAHWQTRMSIFQRQQQQAGCPVHSSMAVSSQFIAAAAPGGRQL